MDKPKPEKPLGHKAYGSIPHLPGSRKGPGDYGLSDKQAAILTTKARDKHDVVYIQEKLDGSCVSVARINGEIVPLIRAGYRAIGSNYKQHHYFHEWVMKPANKKKFEDLLTDGERVCGEWIMQAHGTRYESKLSKEPFFAFDIISGHERLPLMLTVGRLAQAHIQVPQIISGAGMPWDVETVLMVLGARGYHGAVDIAEGAVWRVERNGEFDFMGKFVRPEKGPDGKYLESVTGQGPVWNWTPEELGL